MDLLTGFWRKFDDRHGARGVMLFLDVDIKFKVIHQKVSKFMVQMDPISKVNLPFHLIRYSKI